ncbi:MAG: GNAT family N-acetyltransferase [Candidatus Cloacimonetes bacterium]|nr:GNAT family N-acetyltransferase [Candidatus Cloacimonadota bacterium]MCF7869434.1 GNAT family N-acetyltransferase [Candidatus Cloacimonadota bacterium]MCF7884784.1 GNAT family N-acetyltransferase [Candidatus Cloacimonadota bacterium]
MKYYKKLIGEKVYLSPICVEDAEKYCEWLNDFEVAKNLLIFRDQLSLEREKLILQDMIKNQAQVFGIVLQDKNELIGNSSIFRINHHNRKAEVGIFIGNKNYWGKGYGSEALSLLLDYGFNILNLNNIMLETFSFNERALKSYKKVGFKEIGRRRQAIIMGGKKYDEILLDILAEDFESPFIKKIIEDKG